MRRLCLVHNVERLLSKDLDVLTEQSCRNFPDRPSAVKTDDRSLLAFLDSLASYPTSQVPPCNQARVCGQAHILGKPTCSNKTAFNMFHNERLPRMSQEGQLKQLATIKSEAKDIFNYRAFARLRCATRSRSSRCLWFAWHARNAFSEGVKQNPPALALS